MKASLTSTWISSESMSTIVPMPVRVKPPPAEIGEIISPGWAALAIDHAGERRAHDGVVDLHLAPRPPLPAPPGPAPRGAEPRPQRVALGPRGVERLRGDELRAGELLLALVVPLGLLELGPDLGHLGARGGELRLGERELRLASVSSSRASTAPSSTRMPSSISTSVTLPVILADTVAWRRAVT